MKELQKQLVDLYAGDELSQEAKTALEHQALEDHELAADMLTLKATVSALQNSDAPEMGETSFQRVLLRLYQAGAEPRTESPTPAYWQYQLPDNG